ncbi:hypothetical protein [Pseudonocardia lacus]|uniref:hypothetical protein n=1 Tax=Pseudonocardia lacus TaxID=2835865 RepID=UPI001BDBEAD1|nr:hypothetical protein [Pseudonocardia lacus]
MNDYYDLPSMEAFAGFLMGRTGQLQTRLGAVDEAVRRVWRDVDAFGKQVAPYAVDVAPVTGELYEAGPNARLVQPFHGVTADAVRRLGLATGIAHSMAVDGQQLLAKVTFVREREKVIRDMPFTGSGTNNVAEVARFRDLVFTQAGNHAPELTALMARFRWGGAEAVRDFVRRRGIPPEQLKTLLAAVPAAARALSASDSPPPPQLAGIIGRTPAERHRAWTSELTGDERALYALLHPNLVGQTHGLPAVHRDAANQVILQGRRHDVLVRLGASSGTDDPSQFAAAEQLRMIDFALGPQTQGRYLILDVGHGGGPGGLTLAPLSEAAFADAPKDRATDAWLLEKLTAAGQVLGEANEVANQASGAGAAGLEGLRGPLRGRGFTDSQIDLLFRAIDDGGAIDLAQLEARLGAVGTATTGVDALSILVEELQNRDKTNLSVPGAIGSAGFQFIAGELAAKGVQLACAAVTVETGGAGIVCFAIAEAVKPIVREGGKEAYQIGNVLWHHTFDDLARLQRYVQKNQRLPIAIVDHYDPESPEAPDPIRRLDKPPAAP